MYDRRNQRKLTKGRSVANNLIQKKGEGEGTFIGDSGNIHIHIDIGKPHLKLGGSGDQYDIRGHTASGYDNERMRDALGALERRTPNDQYYYLSVPGFAACLNWLEEQLGLPKTQPPYKPQVSLPQTTATASSVVSHGANTDRLIANSLGKTGPTTYPAKN